VVSQSAIWVICRRESIPSKKCNTRLIIHVVRISRFVFCIGNCHRVAPLNEIRNGYLTGILTTHMGHLLMFSPKLELQLHGVASRSGFLPTLARFSLSKNRSNIPILTSFSLGFLAFCGFVKYNVPKIFLPWTANVQPPLPECRAKKGSL
jgi:hypothetical protein